MLERPPDVDAGIMGPMDPWAPSDPLGEALHPLRMNGAFYCRSELSTPWGLTLPPLPDYLWFHVVTAGEARLEVGEERAVQLRPGDLALVPHGRGHVLRSDLQAPAPGVLELEREAVSERYEILRHGGGGRPARVICGAVRFEHPAARNLVAILPAILRVEATDPGAGDWMQGTLRLMAAEARELRPGGEAVITRLGDILVIQAIRSWIENDPTARTGWLGALRDPQSGRALALIHAEPARDWTLAALAGELAMSRSAFAARFSELVGEPAMGYVTRWRMQLALGWLRDEAATVGECAARLGYRSEAAFARAFKRVTGVPPGTVRRVSPAGAAPADPGALLAA
jgi:AraC-like DNA-binding protein